MKVAIVHYWFITRRGGEKVIESILKIFPDADIYTLFYDKKQYGNHLGNNRVYTSMLDLPFMRRNYQKLFPLYPLGVKSLKLKKKYDLIISSESGPAKGIRLNNRAKHICYIHTPMRYCWSHTDLYINSVHPSLRIFMKFFLNRLRNWDKKTVSNVDLFISNSKNIANRVKQFYKRDSMVIYPPISDDLFIKQLRSQTVKDTYLSFGALTPYKKIDLLVEAFNINGKRLVIVGDGSEKEKLMKRAKSNITFESYHEWSKIEEVFYRTRALLFPGEEDFGMIPLEVMAYGIPVIAFKKGGALETVVEDRSNISMSSGLFFDKQTVKSLLKTLDFFEEVENEFDPGWIKQHASKFSERHFLRNFKEILEGYLSDNNKSQIA